MIRVGALKRPGLILGSFIAIYALARIIGEFFREPDPQLGFLWGGLTMGMLLSVPMIIAGAILIVLAWRRPPSERISQPGQHRDRIFAAAVRDQEADQVVRPDAGLALHGAVPDASEARLLCLARSAGPRGRFHHRARSQPDVRRTARAVGGLGVEGDRLAAAAAADRTRSRPRHHDGGRAARAAGAAAALSGAQHPSGRDQSGAARQAEGDAVGRAQHRLARQHRRGARGARGHFRQRIFRRAADPPGGEARDRLARAHRRDRRQRQAGVRRGARADAALRGAAAAAGARRPGRRGVRVAARCRDHEDRNAGCATRMARR